MLRELGLSRLLVPVSIILLLAALQLFEYALYAPSQSLFPSHTAANVNSYQLIDTYAGSNFFDGFHYETASDPTHGHVQYLSREAAIASNLTYIGLDGKAYIHVDASEPAPQGRKSVRISSRKTYTHGLFVLDVSHMPEGCGTWPAFWSTAVSAWPSKGEIDILEGVNLELDNAFTLHTGPGCRVAQYRAQKGSSESMDCNVKALNQWPNQGCGVKTQDSFGAAFNKEGGAVVMMEWRSEVIRMWIFRRNRVPFDVSVNAPNPDMDISLWGMPDAIFESTECDIDKIFRDHVLIINTTLCGDWAGQVYAQSPCPGTDCASFVSNHPEAFKNAYWAIKSLKVYQMS